MTKAEKKQRLDERIAEMEAIHADYLERFSKLKKKQMALLKEVSARVEALKIGKLMKDIKKSSK
jgi:recombinational DNA repair ATPase RecF